LWIVFIILRKKNAKVVQLKVQP